MRISIIGNSGSGKSTLARALAAQHGLAGLDLDTVAWLPEQIAVARHPQEAAAEVDRFCSEHGDWVVEGCYGSLVSITLVHAPVLLFLEPGPEVCLAHCAARPWEPHKFASKQAQDALLEPLQAWVRDYYQRQGELSLQGHQALFDAYAGPKFKLTAPFDADALSTSTAWGLEAARGA
jgi:adenylate kinase family enzyme